MAQTAADNANAAATRAEEEANAAKQLADGAKDTADSLFDTIGDLNSSFLNSIKRTYMQYCDKKYIFTLVERGNIYDQSLIYYQKGTNEEGETIYQKVRPDVDNNGELLQSVYTKTDPDLPLETETDIHLNKMV